MMALQLQYHNMAHRVPVLASSINGSLMTRTLAAVVARRKWSQLEGNQLNSLGSHNMSCCCCRCFCNAAMPTAIAIKRRLQGHPNMIVMHELFEDAEGYHLILEYVPGPTLDDLISESVGRLLDS